MNKTVLDVNSPMFKGTTISNIESQNLWGWWRECVRINANNNTKGTNIIEKWVLEGLINLYTKAQEKWKSDNASPYGYCAFCKNAQKPLVYDNFMILLSLEDSKYHVEYFNERLEDYSIDFEEYNEISISEYCKNCLINHKICDYRKRLNKSLVCKFNDTFGHSNTIKHMLKMDCYQGYPMKVAKIVMGYYHKNIIQKMEEMKFYYRLRLTNWRG